MSSSVLPLFWNLASASQDTRLAASADLVSSLQTSQAAFSQNAEAGPSALRNGHSANGFSKDTDEDDEDEDESDEDVDMSDATEDAADNQAAEKQFAKQNASDVVYAVKRLLRGLASSRESSRLGFAVALTEILSRIRTISTTYVLFTLLRSTKTSKSMRGHEERDALFARLFGLAALIDSGSLWAAEAPSNAQVVLGQVVDELLKLGQAKSWMRESAWWSVSRAAAGLQASQAKWTNAALLQLAEKTFAEKGLSREQLAIWLQLEQLGLRINWTERLAPHIRHTPLLARGNLTTVARALKGTGDNETEGQKAVSGPSRAQLHSVWTVILDRLLVQGGLKSGQAPFGAFWQEVVEDGLFGEASSSQQRYHGLQFFQLALPRVSLSDIPTLFSAHLMHCLINNLLAPDRYLHKAAQAAVRTIQDAVKARPEIASSVIKGLTEGNGRYDFDRATKTKTVEGVIGHLTANAVEGYADNLIRIFLHPGRDELIEDSGEARQQWVTEQLSLLCRSIAVPKSDKWVKNALQTLLLHGCYKLVKPTSKSSVPALRLAPEHSISAPVAEACREALFSCLASLTTGAPSRRSQDGSQGTDSSGALWLEHAVSWAESFSKDTKHVTSLSPVDSEDQLAVLASAMKLIGSAPRKSDVGSGAAILLSWLYLQALGASGQVEDDEAPQELARLASAMRGIAELLELERPVAQLDGEEEDEDESPPIDRLVAQLLGLLEEASSDSRSIANMVFGLLSEKMTSSAVERMGEQLLLTIGEEVEEASDIDEDETVDDAADVDGEDEDTEHKASSSDDEDEDEEDEDSSNETEEDDEELPPVDPEFRKKVAAALGLRDSDIGMDDDSDDESDSDDEEGGKEGSDDDESEDEVYMDDDAMLKMDEQLADVFRLQAQQAKKTDARQLETENLHYRSRVLDFFDILLQKRATSAIVLEALVPLLQLAGSPVAARPELSNKLGGIIRTRIGKAKDVISLHDQTDDGEGELPVPDVKRTVAILTEIHEMVRKSATAEVSALSSLCSLLIVKTLDGAQSVVGRQAAAEAYGKTMDDFMVRKQSSVHPPFLLDFVRRFPVMAWPLVGKLVQHIAPASTVKAFRQIQAFGMLSVFSQSLGLLAKSVSSSDIESFIDASAAAVVDTLNQVASGAVERRTDFLREAVKFALHLARTSKSVVSAETYKTVWDRSAWEATLGALREGKATKEMKGVHNMVQQLLGIVAKSEAKPQVNGAVNGEATRKEKKRKLDVDAPSSAKLGKGEKKDKKKKREPVA